MKKNASVLLSVILVLAFLLSACSKGQVPAETTAATTVATVSTVPTVPVETTIPVQPLALTSWNMSASTWSSPNGATVHISATTNYYSEEQTVDFTVRLEGDDIITVPCQWDGSSYNASADLNAANGYCYYLVLTAADGTSEEVAVNTPTSPTNKALINMEASLDSYCSVTITDSSFDNNCLILSDGSAQVQTPAITNDGETISCKEALLILRFNGEEIGKKELALSETETAGLLEASLEDITFDIPTMESEQKVELTLNVTLTNGQILNAFGGDWVYSEDGLMPMVG